MDTAAVTHSAARPGTSTRLSAGAARAVLTLLLGLALGGCGYFNAMYNANRAFADAERARARGEPTLARTAYNDAIDKAAGSYRRHPDSRWADDALLLIGRARFHLGQDAQAAGALRALLEASDHVEQRVVAHAYLGAALARLDDRAAAVHLDSAIAHLPSDAAEGALARRWRARVAFATNDTAVAWRLMDEAMRSRQAAFEVALDAAAEAAARRDTLRLRMALSTAAKADPRGAQAEAVNAVLRAAARPGFEAAAFRSTAALDSAEWRPAMVDAVTLERARLAAAAGEDDAALTLAARLHDATANIATAARLLHAQLTLARLADPDGLEAIRQMLLPAFADPNALELQRVIRAVQLLASRASEGGVLPLFAAAEIARDELQAPSLAQALFLEFVRLDPASAWSGKAALAAHAIGPTPATAAALQAAAASPYVAVANGADPRAIDLAEQRLARGLAGMRAEALAEAVMRDVVVGRAASLLDSTRAAARSDSLRIACAMFVDSLSLAGVRADSTRAACLRSDTVRVAFVLTADTSVLLGTPKSGDDPRPRSGAIPDTVPLR